MKRWNKQKRYREARWTAVKGMTIRNHRKALDWCLQREGKKFFDDFSTWYFEDPQDALVFSLTWIGKSD